mgnify:CR=1 FL=1
MTRVRPPCDRRGTTAPPRRQVGHLVRADSNLTLTIIVVATRRTAGTRAKDTDRNDTCQILDSALGEGQLSMEEHRERVAPARTEDQRAALFSTVHGAGRVMSRTEARGKINWKTRQVRSPGKVSWNMLHEWIGRKGVILRGGGLDESPHAYRRLPDVLSAQGGTVQVVHTLKPLIVVMAGENEFDPYKD